MNTSPQERAVLKAIAQQGGTTGIPLMPLIQYQNGISIDLPRPWDEQMMNAMLDNLVAKGLVRRTGKDNLYYRITDLGKTTLGPALDQGVVDQPDRHYPTVSEG